MGAIGTVMNSLFGSGSGGAPAGAAVSNSGVPASGGNPALANAGNNAANNPNNANPAAGGKDGNAAGTGPTADINGTGPAPSPMDKFNKLWETSPNAGPQKMFNVDPAKVLEAAKGIDFAKMIPDGALDKIAAGGPEAAKAFVDSIQSVAANLQATGSMTTANLIEQALAKQAEIFTKQLPSLLKAHGLNEGMRSQHPVLSHPAAVPLTSALVKALSSNPQFSGASTSELTGMANEFLINFADSIKGSAPGAATQDSKDTKIDTNWDSFLQDGGRG